MSIAKTFYAAISAYISKVAFTVIRLNTLSVHATLFTNRLTASWAGFVSISTYALETFKKVQAKLRIGLAFVMTVGAFILWRTFYIMPSYVSI